MLLTRRVANANDIDSITEVAIAGFAQDPQWIYRYPHRKSCPDMHYKFVRMGIEDYWQRTQRGRNHMLVVEAPANDDPSIRKVISFSIWDKPGSKEAVPPAKVNYRRPDGSERRLRAFARKTIKARQDLFVARYGPDQMSLRLMVTHPDYWRRSAATLMMQWGIEEAVRRDVAIVMFASQLGRKLYRKFNFKELAKIRVRVKGERESVDISCLAWEPGWTIATCAAPRPCSFHLFA